MNRNSPRMSTTVQVYGNINSRAYHKNRKYSYVFVSCK